MRRIVLYCIVKYRISFISFINCTGKNSSTDNKNSKENKNMYVQFRRKKKKKSSTLKDFKKSKLNYYRVNLRKRQRTLQMDIIKTWHTVCKYSTIQAAKTIKALYGH